MFRELTKKKQSLSNEKIVEILCTEKRGVLSVLGDNGYPYGVPINYWYNEENGKLYLNGELVASNDKMFTMEKTFPDQAPTYNWMGRAPFKGDSYLKGTTISDVRMYDKALTEKQIRKLYNKLK